MALRWLALRQDLCFSLEIIMIPANMNSARSPIRFASNTIGWQRYSRRNTRRLTDIADATEFCDV